MVSAERVVLHVMGTLRASGMEMMFSSSAGIWQEFNWKVIILCQGSHHQYLNELAEQGYEIVKTRSLRSFRGLTELIKVLLKIRPEVVHVHVESMHGIIAFLTRMTLPKVRLVQTIHSAFHFHGLNKMKRIIQHKLSRFVGTHFVSVSYGVAGNELLNYALESRVIENWVSSDLASFKARNVSEHSISIALIGNCSSIKNHEIVLSSCIHIENISFLHIGDETNATITEKQLLDKFTEIGKVVRTGQVEDISDYLLTVDLVAIPSIMEGFSVVLAEAICMGIPVAISTSEGMDWARHLPNVITVKSDKNWQETLSSLTRNDISELKNVSELLRKDLLDRFSPIRGVREYVDIYK